MALPMRLLMSSFAPPSLLTVLPKCWKQIASQQDRNDEESVQPVLGGQASAFAARCTVQHGHSCGRCCYLYAKIFGKRNIQILEAKQRFSVHVGLPTVLSSMLTMTILSVMISITYAQALSGNLFTISCNALLLPAIRSKSSANHRLHRDRN